MYRVIITDPAKRDVQAAHDWWAENRSAERAGQWYVDQIKGIAGQLGVPIISGATPQKRRDRLFEDFMAGRCQVLAVSKVANFAVDLPDASVAIQISGTFGSRQEEAQRLGRILRPQAGLNQAHFYVPIKTPTKDAVMLLLAASDT